MARDFSSILKKAEEVKENANSGGGTGAKELYIGKGTTMFRMLYNPKSDSVLREISRHWVGGIRKFVPCLSMYGMECPICKIKDEYKATTGKDPDWSFNAQRRGIGFVTFEGASDPVEKGPEPGSTVVAVLPISVYNKLNEFLTSQPEKLGVLLTAPETPAIVIKRDDSGPMTKYDANFDPFKTIKTIKDAKGNVPADGEAQMDALLEGLDDLNEYMFPSKYNDEIGKLMEEAVASKREELKLPTPVVDGPPKP